VEEKENAMRTTSTYLFIIAQLSVSLLLAAGCSDASIAPSTEKVDEKSDELLVCPIFGKAEYQKRVTAYVDYVLGSPASPFAAYPCQLPLTTTTAQLAATTLRTAIALGTCTVGGPIESTVCGLPAAERLVSCLGVSGPELAVIAGTGETLDLCWGVGASGFFHSSQDGLYTYIDPEPVVTTQSLTGSNGATAAALYQNSGTSTRVTKWYSTGIFAPNLDPGAPCSTSDLPEGATAIKVILASGPYKRCG